MTWKNKPAQLHTSISGASPVAIRLALNNCRRLSGPFPYELWLNLCFESIVFGLSFFWEYARKHYTASERELFVSELDTAMRWLLATTLFDPGDIDHPPSQPSRSVAAYSQPMDFNERP